MAVQRFTRARFRFTNYYEKHTGSVGPALPGVEVRLIDVPEKGIRVTEGGEGEVLVRGPNVFMGYWDAPRSDPEAPRHGWLRTGDLGRIDREGNIYLTGRSKYIIVLESGEKVHPDELEANLRQSPLHRRHLHHRPHKTAATAPSSPPSSTPTPKPPASAPPPSMSPPCAS